MNTPELDKMLSNKKESQSIGAFLDWLQSEKRIILCKYQNKDSNYPMPIHGSIEQLLADYFGVDLEKAEKERQEILNNLRKQKT